VWVSAAAAPGAATRHAAARATPWPGQRICSSSPRSRGMRRDPHRLRTWAALVPGLARDAAGACAPTDPPCVEHSFARKPCRVLSAKRNWANGPGRSRHRVRYAISVVSRLPPPTHSVLCRIGAGSTTPSSSWASRSLMSRTRSQRRRRAVKDLPLCPRALNLHPLADERQGHRVAGGLQAHPVVLRDYTRQPCLEPKARLPRREDKLRVRAGKAVPRALLRRAGRAPLGEGGVPLGERGIEVGLVEQVRPGRQWRLRDFTPLSTWRLRSIGWAAPRLKVPSVGKGLEGGVADPLAATGPVVEVLRGWPPKCSKARAWASRNTPRFSGG
jgi:hypothetical protein